MKKRIASCSFGKDSLAMVLLLIEKNEPLDEVVFYDTGMEFQAIYNIRDRMLPVFEQHGVRYTELKPERPFLMDMLAREHRKRTGEWQYGYGWCGGACRWGTSNKLASIERYCKGHHQYIGIAADEPLRLARLEEGKSSPLAKWGMTEPECLMYCRSHGISWGENGVDLYDVLSRVSCWCCRNKNKEELRNIWRFLPDYWQRLKALQTRIPEPMKSYENKKYGAYGNLFALEKVFEQEEKTRQLSIFDMMMENA